MDIALSITLAVIVVQALAMIAVAIDRREWRLSAQCETQRADGWKAAYDSECEAVCKLRDRLISAATSSGEFHNDRPHGVIAEATPPSTAMVDEHGREIAVNPARLAAREHRQWADDVENRLSHSIRCGCSLSDSSKQDISVACDEHHCPAVTPNISDVLIAEPTHG